MLQAIVFALAALAPVRVLIVDGQNNHDWQATTPVLKRILEETGRFQVSVATTPGKGADMSGFKPDFGAYDVVLLNYNGDPWPAETKAAFERYVAGGGGVVIYHAADNAFPEWKAYNEMIGVGGWGGRTRNNAPCGHHGARLPFEVTMRDPDHPIAQGLPRVWMHAADELYDSLCGPGENLDVVATAHSDPANHGTGKDEPMLMAIRYGQGRIFHTALGHDVAAMQDAGFRTTLQRGTEWAATGQVRAASGGR